MHRHFPQFTTSLDLDIYLYIYPTPIYKTNKNLLRFTDLLLPHMYTLNNIKNALNYQNMNICSVFHTLQNSCHKMFFTSPFSLRYVEPSS